jgi:hypothetical protein
VLIGLLSRFGAPGWWSRADWHPCASRQGGPVARMPHVWVPCGRRVGVGRAHLSPAPTAAPFPSAPCAQRRHRTPCSRRAGCLGWRLAPILHVLTFVMKGGSPCTLAHNLKCHGRPFSREARDTAVRHWHLHGKLQPPDLTTTTWAPQSARLHATTTCHLLLCRRRSFAGAGAPAAAAA